MPPRLSRELGGTDDKKAGTVEIGRPGLDTTLSDRLPQRSSLPRR